jgi:hypothetical protein
MATPQSDVQRLSRRADKFTKAFVARRPFPGYPILAGNCCAASDPNDKVRAAAADLL